MRRAALEPIPASDDDVALIGEPGRNDDALPEAVRACDVTDDDPVSWAVASIALRAEPTVLVAEGGSLKTTIVTSLCAAYATGRPAFDHPAFTTEGGPSLIISAEDSKEIIKNRLEALATGHGWDLDTVLGNVHILAAPGEVTLDSAQWQAHILATIERIEPGIVVLDPWADLVADENSPDAGKPYIRFVRRAAALGPAVIVSHHVGKPVENRSKQHRIRGSSGLYNAARAAFYLELTDAGVVVECIKMNRAEKTTPFVLTPSITEKRPGVWRTASLRYVTRAVAQEQTADQFILEQLTLAGSLKSSELKELAKTRPGISAADVSGAIKRLSIIGRIDYEPGPHGAKNWTLATLPNVARQGRQPTLPSLPNVARQGRGSASDLAHLVDGARSQTDATLPGNLDDDDDYESEYESIKRREAA